MSEIRHPDLIKYKKYWETAQNDLSHLFAVPEDKITISEGVVTRPRLRASTYLNQSGMAISLPQRDGGEAFLVLQRSQGFTPYERYLAHYYAETMWHMFGIEQSGFGGSFWPVLKEELVELSIASLLAGEPSTTFSESQIQLRDAAASALRYLKSSLVSKYEGQALNQSIVLVNQMLQKDCTPEAILLETLGDREALPWVPNIGSQNETAILLSADGFAYGIQDLNEPLVLDEIGESPQVEIDSCDGNDWKNPKNLGTHLFSEEISSLAHFTYRYSCSGFALLPSGDLVVVQAGELKFVHRGGGWKPIPPPNLVSMRFGDASLTHGIDAKGSGQLNSPVRRAIIESLLDASGHHRGATIALVSKSHRAEFFESCIEGSLLDRNKLWQVPPSLQSRSGRKSKAQVFEDKERERKIAETLDPRYHLIRRSIGGRLGAPIDFTNLSRSQRLELLSMDGATIIDHYGNVVACGVIVEVEGGASGGRKAAALSLANYGCAFKVSQDGEVTMYGPKVGDGREDDNRLLNRFG